MTTHVVHKPNTIFNKCADCGSRKAPLKWYQFWEVWLCHNCKEARIRKWMPDVD